MDEPETVTPPRKIESIWQRLNIDTGFFLSAEEGGVGGREAVDKSVV